MDRMFGLGRKGYHAIERSTTDRSTVAALRSDDHIVDEKLRLQLESYSETDREYWSFNGKAVREHVHAYFQYPAMMVPQMQGELIRAVLKTVPSIRNVFDPFVGSGTVMTEAMLQGLDFTGQDINPLAVLISRAKAGPFYVRAVVDQTEELLHAIKNDRNVQLEAEFAGRDKWFRRDVAIELSRIRRAIRRQRTSCSRRFLWVALAETVRLTSNSRTSTFKLHVRPAEEIASRNTSPVQVFEEVVSKNIESLRSHHGVLKQRELLNRGNYRGSVKIHLGNSANWCPYGNDGYDLLVTSPPYGDNGTTVPYGQHSFLPLQWIDPEDIGTNADAGWLSTTHEIDARSLGGSKVRALEDTAHLLEISESYRRVVDALKYEPRDRLMRVAAFCRDLDRSMDPVLSVLRPNAYMLWTIGNRRVGGQLIPIDEILTELLCSRGATFVTKIQRTIPANSKRMAGKNGIASTMGAEAVLVMRKGKVW